MTNDIAWTPVDCDWISVSTVKMILIDQISSRLDLINYQWDSMFVYTFLVLELNVTGERLNKIFHLGEVPPQFTSTKFSKKAYFLLRLTDSEVKYFEILIA